MKTDDYVFGRFTTDHMLSIDYDGTAGGWGKPKIEPYGPFRIHLGATSLHYGLSCFEGMNILQNRDT